MERRRALRRALSVAVLVIATAQPPASAQQPVSCAGPLSQSRVIRLLNEQVSEKRVVEWITTCGVDFELTPDTEENLRAVNATAGVLSAIKTEQARRAQAAIQATAERERLLEQGAWDAIASATDPKVFEEFLKRYPDGVYAAEARTRVSRLETSTRGNAASREGVSPDLVSLEIYFEGKLPAYGDGARLRFESPKGSVDHWVRGPFEGRKRVWWGTALVGSFAVRWGDWERQLSIRRCNNVVTLGFKQPLIKFSEKHLPVRIACE